MNVFASDGWVEFLGQIKDAKDQLQITDRIWYRGQPNSENYLLPSLLLYENGIDKEKFLYDGFRKFTERLFQKHSSDWETLFEMQHYGIPTRLLDWSETFSIALFFAAYYNNKNFPNSDAAVYLLNPVRLNAPLCINVLRIPDDQEHLEYSETYIEHRKPMHQSPIAIEPNFINGRMLAQRGMFTVHHNTIEPIEDRFPEAIKKIILKKQLVKTALDFLELSNVNEYTVYPDIAGISGFLKDSAELKYRQ